ncbi:VOC family protein [Alkalicoccus daliensis]|uniref:PhnB protein n=1 Tax=Alkalicoccus daliensis TaxID=745820 RepID=A0A1H0HJE3_9BACI|nr:VOC family protein [Alkalicoccus daliensis]SDO18951.1 PhnB protein [Alkalicoccus daliensis]
MAINVYLNFNGNCRQAVEFYADVFDTEAPHIMTFGDMPPDNDYPLPEKAKELVMHTQMLLQGTRIMFSDVLPHMKHTEGNNISLAVVLNDESELRRLYGRLAEEGKVQMELQETSWSSCYASLTDKFGIEWQLNYEEEPV